MQVPIALLTALLGAVPLEALPLQFDPFGIGQVPTLFLGLVVLVVVLSIVRFMVEVALRLIVIAGIVLGLLWVAATLGFDVPIF